MAWSMWTWSWPASSIDGQPRRMRIVCVAVLAGFSALVLAGCQHQSMTLEEAQAACAKKGGLLAVIYTQKITVAGLEPEVASPGDCIRPDKFDAAPPAASNAPAPAN
jgi:hypothetical protein